MFFLTYKVNPPQSTLNLLGLELTKNFFCFGFRGHASSLEMSDDFH